MAEQPWTGKTDRRIRSERDHQVTLCGSTDGRPLLFIGRKRGGGLLATLSWPALLEIADLVERLQNREQLQALRESLRRTLQAQGGDHVGELRRPLAARRARR